MKKTSTVLKNARDLMITSGWTKGALARNKYRHAVDPSSPSAVKFCAYGALNHVLGLRGDDPDSKEHIAALNRLETVLKEQKDSGSPGFYNWLDSYNDAKTTTLKDIESLFNLAIREAKREEKKG